MIRILACTPTYTGQVVVPFLQSFVASFVDLANHGIMMELRCANHFSLVQYARNWLTREFLEGDYTHLLWIDSDLGWDPTAIRRMVARDKDVIAGIYPLKQKSPVIFPYLREGEPQDGMQLAERVPTGFMLCKRHVMEKAAESVRSHGMEYAGKKFKVPNLFDIVQENDDAWGEDFAFCKRLRMLGIDIWVELDVSFTHWGLHGYGGNLMQNFSASPAPVAAQSSAA